MTDRMANPWGGRTPFGRDEDWPVRVDRFLEKGRGRDPGPNRRRRPLDGPDRDGPVASGRLPPTGATTLIVSLGFLQTPPEMAALVAGVVLLTVVGWLLNRAAGVPVWRTKDSSGSAG